MTIKFIIRTINLKEITHHYLTGIKIGAQMDDQSLYSWKPLTLDTWPDLVKLFGENGACGGCWCMFFHGTKKEWNESKGDGNRNRLLEIVKTGQAIGILAYNGDEPVGWCAVSPRRAYDALERSKYYQAVDDTPTWSLTCFFTARNYRRKGVTRYIVPHGMQYAHEQGAKFLEAYPIIPKKAKVPDIFAYTGFYQEFLDLGFEEIANRDGLHPIMRICLD